MSSTKAVASVTTDRGTNATQYVTTAMSPPPALGLRQFLRGGYRDLSVPTVIYDVSHRPVGTWFPGTITQETVQWSYEDPDWLEGSDK